MGKACGLEIRNTRCQFVKGTFEWFDSIGSAAHIVNVIHRGMTFLGRE